VDLYYGGGLTRIMNNELRRLIEEIGNKTKALSRRSANHPIAPTTPCKVEAQQVNIDYLIVAMKENKVIEPGHDHIRYAKSNMEANAIFDNYASEYGVFDSMWEKDWSKCPINIIVFSSDIGGSWGVYYQSASGP